MVEPPSEPNRVEGYGYLLEEQWDDWWDDTRPIRVARWHVYLTTRDGVWWEAGDFPTEDEAHAWAREHLVLD